jgi:hypothetical protein
MLQYNSAEAYVKNIIKGTEMCVRESRSSNGLLNKCFVPVFFGLNPIDGLAAGYPFSIILLPDRLSERRVKRWCPCEHQPLAISKEKDE